MYPTFLDAFTPSELLNHFDGSTSMLSSAGELVYPYSGVQLDLIGGPQKRGFPHEDEIGSLVPRKRQRGEYCGDAPTITTDLSGASFEGFDLDLDHLAVNLDFSVPTDSLLTQDLPEGSVHVDAYNWMVPSLTVDTFSSFEGLLSSTTATSIVPQSFEGVEGSVAAIKTSALQAPTDSQPGEVDDSIIQLLNQFGTDPSFQIPITTEEPLFSLPTAAIPTDSVDFLFANPDILPSETETVGSTNSYATDLCVILDRLAKEERLMQLREEARRLEQDLSHAP